jgi:hypothetical protein
MSGTADSNRAGGYFCIQAKHIIGYLDFFDLKKIALPCAQDTQGSQKSCPLRRTPEAHVADFGFFQLTKISSKTSRISGTLVYSSATICPKIFTFFRFLYILIFISY